MLPVDDSRHVVHLGASTLVIPVQCFAASILTGPVLYSMFQTIASQMVDIGEDVARCDPHSAAP